MELLDELCSTSGKYTLGSRKDASGKEQKAWILVQGESSITIDGSVSLGGNEQKMYSRQLESYCGRILEEYDEDMVDLLKTERFDDEGMSHLLTAWPCLVRVNRQCAGQQLAWWKGSCSPPAQWSRQHSKRDMACPALLFTWLCQAV